MTQSLRIVAVDDEPLALRRIELLVGKIPGADLVGVTMNPAAATELITQLRPDVVLLDIKMAGLTGFDLVEQLTAPAIPIVIFVTAFDEFASKAFDVGAADYVLKPVELARLAAALDRARSALAAADAQERLKELQQVVAALRSVPRSSGTKRYETEIWAERRNRFERILVSDLDWIQAERDYVRLHACGQTYLLRETISGLQERLDPEAFIRVRRSALVRVDRVAGIRKAAYGDFRVSLTDGNEIRVGRTYVQPIRRLIDPRGQLSSTD